MTQAADPGSKLEEIRRRLQAETEQVAAAEAEEQPPPPAEPPRYRKPLISIVLIVLSVGIVAWAGTRIYLQIRLYQRGGSDASESSAPIRPPSGFNLSIQRARSNRGAQAAEEPVPDEKGPEFYILERMNRKPKPTEAP